MINIKSDVEIEKLKIAGKITALAMEAAKSIIAPGVSTADLDTIIFRTIKAHGAVPSFLNLYGFPASACISVNDQVIHGIPTKKVILKEGDIVSIDVGAYYDGFHGDMARTFPVGKVSEEAEKLIRVTKECFYKGFEQSVIGNRVGDIGAAVDAHAVENGFSTVKQFVGHGVGRKVHEDPEVPNFGKAGHGPRLMKGMVIAIVPMINAGEDGVWQDDDGWTIYTDDGRLSAHYENTIAITDDGPIILTTV
ncbi:MAG: type I methionyl aminopeptidase [Clostridia bacterium]|nr:type I methionyl aminopeptidase [Clostridia bacterium]